MEKQFATIYTYQLSLWERSHIYDFPFPFTLSFTENYARCLDRRLPFYSSDVNDDGPPWTAFLSL